MNPRASAEVKERLRALYELDKPLHEQYLSWLKKLVVLDLGNSFSPDGRPVADKILERIPITIIINALSLGLIIAVALPVGVASAVRRNSLFDKVTTVLVFVGFAMPTFWLAMILIMFFVYQLKIFPSAGMHSIPPPQGIMYFLDLLWHMTLPLLTLLLIGFWGVSYMVRNIVLSILQEDYIMAARARGIPETKCCSVTPCARPLHRSSLCRCCSF